MASDVSICNSALQKLGAQRISALNESSKQAVACRECFTEQRDALLRSHPWKFAIKRAELAAESPDPDWGRAHAYPLPEDYLGPAPDYPEDNTLSNDFEIEGGKILSDWESPIYIRYVARITDANLMDPLFREALAAKMAYQMCEQLTQSKNKKEGLRQDVKDAIAEARRRGAFETKPPVLPDSSWLSERNA